MYFLGSGGLSAVTIASSVPVSSGGVDDDLGAVGALNAELIGLVGGASESLKRVN